MDQFIDICILCGCDYTDSIRGIGPKKAFEFIKRYKNIETLLAHLDKNKYSTSAEVYCCDAQEYATFLATPLKERTVLYAGKPRKFKTLPKQVR